MNRNSITLLSVKFKNIPDDIKKTRQWVVWKAKLQNNGKFSKIPIDPKTGTNASVTDPNTWSSYLEACHYYRLNKKSGISGIGFVFTKDDSYCGIDLDNCYDSKTNQIEKHILEKLKYINSYSEISPSNTGIKTIVKAKLPGSGRNFKIPNQSSSIEIYDHARFFTVTGNKLNQFSFNIEDRDSEISAAYRKLSSKNDTNNKSIKGDLDGSLGNLSLVYGTKKLIIEGEKKGKRSEAIMSVINSLVKANVTEERIIQLFEEYPIGEKYKEKGAGRQKWLKRHIEKARNFLNHNERNNGYNTDFPLKVISGVAGEFSRIYGSYLEPPDHFFYMSFLTMFGLSVADRLHFKTHRRPQPRFYVILLGESANARKSTALDETEKFFKNISNDNKFNVCKGAASGEGIAKLMMGKSKLLLVYDEFNSFVSKSNIKNSTLLTATNTLFESNQYTNQTSKNPVVIDDGYVSMLAASTTDTYYDLFDQKFINIGFTNRLFLVPGDSDKCFAIPKVIPPEKIQRIKEQLMKCYTLIDTIPEMSIDKDARAKWELYYKQLKQGFHYTKRLDTYGLRLMPLLAINDMKTSVDAETVKKVIDILNWQLNVRKIYDPIDAEGKIAKMEEKIRRAFSEKSSWKKRDLQRKVNYRTHGIWVWDTAVNNLLKNEEIDFNPKSKLYNKR